MDTIMEKSPENGRKRSDFLSREELQALKQPSDIKAIAMLVANWAMIIGAFAIAIIWPNPVTIILGILLLGSRQLGLGVLQHDCAHKAFMTNPKINDFVGHWLCGAPINVSVYAYRAYHLKHHQYAGTPDDPDLVFVKNYPIDKAALKRKFMRDLSGRTGFRDTFRKIQSFKLGKHYPWLGFHILLLTSLIWVEAPWAYAMWWAAELFVYPAITRLRQIGEHGVAINRRSRDARENTGSTLAAWWERLFIAPNFVNYHIEHHNFAMVPCYNLPKLHQLLLSRGYYEGYDCLTRGYLNVLKRAVKPSPDLGNVAPQA